GGAPSGGAASGGADAAPSAPRTAVVLEQRPRALPVEGGLEDDGRGVHVARVGAGPVALVDAGRPSGGAPGGLDPPDRPPGVAVGEKGMPGVSTLGADPARSALDRPLCPDREGLAIAPDRVVVEVVGRRRDRVLAGDGDLARGPEAGL